MRNSIRITAAALALAVGMTGAAQAEPFNIFSASKTSEASNGSAAQLEQVRWRGHRRHWRGRGWGPGIALGTFGLALGAAAASSYYGPRYYCDPYYEYCGPRRRVYRRYYEPYYYAPRRYYYYD